MIFLGDFYKVSKDRYRVQIIHYLPFDKKHGLGKSVSQLEQEGVLVESIPEPDKIEGKSSALYINPESKELWYEYEDIPKTQEDKLSEKVNQLDAQLQITQEAIDFLIMRGVV